MPMTELNFMFLHSEVVGKVKFAKTLSEAMKVLKINSVVGRVSRRSLADVAGDDIPETAEPSDPVAGTSSVYGSKGPSKGSAVKGKKGKGQSAGIQGQNPWCGAASRQIQQGYVTKQLKDAATQTEELDFESEEEDPVVAENINEIHCKYMCDKIREEDFDETLDGSK